MTPKKQERGKQVDRNVITWPVVNAFAFGHTYTRGQIRAALGGDLSSDFPHRGGRVVCGCFRPDLNPDAPDVILPGRGPAIERWARVFVEQPGFIPCFVRVHGDAWEYVGAFRVRRVISDAAELGARARAASRPARALSMVLYLRGK